MKPATRPTKWWSNDWLEKLKAESAAPAAAGAGERTGNLGRQHASSTVTGKHMHVSCRFADAWRNGGHLGEKQFASCSAINGRLQ